MVFEHLAKTLAKVPDLNIYFQPRIGSLRADIVILRKDFGVAILEVKDWSIDSYRIVYDKKVDSDPRWFSASNGVEVYSPHSQVTTYKNKLISEAGLDIKKIFDPSVYGLITTTLILANTKQSTVRKIDHLTQKFVKVFGRDGLSTNAAILLNDVGLHRQKSTSIKKEIEQLIRVLEPPTTPTQPAIQVQLYRRQQEAMQLPSNNRRKIRGVAGSGKTIVGVQIAAAEALKENHSVLFAVYNLAAKAAVYRTISAIDVDFPRKNVIVETIFGFARPYLRVDMDKHLVSKSYFQELREGIESSLLQRALSADCEKYDAIIVDEAQDYEYEWMKILESSFLKPRGKFIVLADEAQNIYGISLEDNRVRTPITGQWFRLDEQKRADPKVSNMCDNFRAQFHNDTEHTTPQLPFGLSSVHAYPTATQSISDLIRVTISDTPFRDILKGTLDPSQYLVVARTSEVINALIEDFKRVGSLKIKVKSTVESELQRCNMFFRSVHQVLKSKRTGIMFLGSVVGESILLRMESLLKDGQIDRVAEHFYDELNKFQNGESLLNKDDRGLCVMYNKILDAEEKATSLYVPEIHMSDKKYSNDLAHVFSFKLAELRRVLKSSAFAENVGLVISTAHSAKGIERPNVILLVDSTWHLNPNPHELMYTALSRAKQELHIVYNESSPYAKFFKENSS